MEKIKCKCHICKKEFIYNAIGRHYKYIHSINLMVDENYIKYYNYNHPNFIKKIINECNIEKKSVNVLLKEKYPEIGEGQINRLQKLLKNKINVNRNDIIKLKTIKRNKTCLDKYGSIYSDEFKTNICGFKKNPELAKRASLIAVNNPTIKKARRKYFNSPEFKEKRINILLAKYGTLITRAKSTSKGHLKMKKLLIENNIITEHEINILDRYIIDEFDRNKNVCIEFNGDFWHCNPNIFDKEYFHPIIKMTAEEIWKRDKRKYNKLKNNKYDVFIVWESDNLDDKIKEYKLKYDYV